MSAKAHKHFAHQQIQYFIQTFIQGSNWGMVAQFELSGLDRPSPPKAVIKSRKILEKFRACEHGSDHRSSATVECVTGGDSIYPRLLRG